MSPNLRELLSAHIQKSNVSINVVARQVGVSPATLSTWLRGEYKGNVSKIDETVGSYLARQAEKTNLRRVNALFVETTAAKRVIASTRMAHLRGKLCVITGRAGCGKSFALREYTKRNPSTILMEVESTFTKDAMLRELHRLVGLGPGRGVLRNVMADICTKLVGSERLIVIDEAEQLSIYALELLRAIHDKTGVGLVLAGMTRLIENLRGLRGEYEQLYSRCADHLHLDENMTMGDTGLITQTYPINPAGNVKLLYACSKGNPRMLANLLEKIVDQVQHSGQPVSKEMIEDLNRTALQK